MGDFAPGSRDTDAVARRADGETFGPLLTEWTGRPRLDFNDADPETLRLESAWRSLHFLIRRLKLREDIVVDVLAATEANWLEKLRTLIGRESGDAGTEPLGLIVAAWTLSPVEGSAVTLLREGAEAARTAGAPLLAGLTLEAADGLIADPAWAAFRAGESADWLGVAVNRFLLRGEGPGVPVFAAPALAVAVAAGRSHAEHRWPTHLSGSILEDLPIHETKDGFIPTEVLLQPDRIAALEAGGLIPLVAARNKDQARVPGAPSAHLERPLSVRIAAARLTALLGHPLRASRGIAEPEAFESEVRKIIKTAIPSIAEYTIHVVPDPTGQDQSYRLTLEFRAVPPILTEPRDMKLDFRFGR